MVDRYNQNQFATERPVVRVSPLKRNYCPIFGVELIKTRFKICQVLSTISLRVTHKDKKYY